MAYINFTRTPFVINIVCPYEIDVGSVWEGPSITWPENRSRNYKALRFKGDDNPEFARLPAMLDMSQLEYFYLLFEEESKFSCPITGSDMSFYTFKNPEIDDWWCEVPIRNRPFANHVSFSSILLAYERYVQGEEFRMSDFALHQLRWELEQYNEFHFVFQTLFYGTPVIQWLKTGSIHNNRKNARSTVLMGCGKPSESKFLNLCVNTYFDFRKLSNFLFLALLFTLCLTVFGFSLTQSLGLWVLFKLYSCKPSTLRVLYGGGRPKGTGKNKPKSIKVSTGSTEEKKKLVGREHVPPLDLNAEQRRLNHERICKTRKRMDETFGVRCVTMEPSSKFSLSSSQRLKFIERPVKYVLLDINGRRFELMQGNNTCLLDAMFYLYICQQEVHTNDHFLSCLNNFNKVLLKLCQTAPSSCSILKNRKAAANFKGIAFGSDIIDFFCIELGMSVLVVSNGIVKDDGSVDTKALGFSEYPETASSDVTIRGTLHVGRWSGVIRHVSDGQGHFNVVTGFEISPSFDVNQLIYGMKFNTVNTTWTNLFYSFRSSRTITTKIGQSYTVPYFVFPLVKCPYEVELLYLNHLPESVVPATPKTEIDSSKLPPLPPSRIRIFVSFGKDIEKQNVIFPFTDQETFSNLMNRIRSQLMGALPERDRMRSYLTCSDAMMILHPSFKIRMNEKLHNGLHFTLVSASVPWKSSYFYITFSRDKLMYRYLQEKFLLGKDQDVSYLYGFELTKKLNAKFGRTFGKFNIWVNPDINGFVVSDEVKRIDSKILLIGEEMGMNHSFNFKYGLPQNIKPEPVAAPVQDIKIDEIKPTMSADVALDVSDKDDDKLDENALSVKSVGSVDQDSSTDLTPVDIGKTEAIVDLSSSSDSVPDVEMFSSDDFDSVDLSSTVSEKSSVSKSDASVKPDCPGPKPTDSKTPGDKDKPLPPTGPVPPPDPVPPIGPKGPSGDGSDDKKKLDEIPPPDEEDDDSDSDDGPKEEEFDYTNSGFCVEWNVRFPTFAGDKQIEGLSLVMNLFLEIFAGNTKMFYTSKICRVYMAKHFVGRLFKNFRTKFASLRACFASNGGVNYLRAVAKAVKSLNDNKKYIMSPKYFELFVSSSYSLRRISDNFKCKFYGIANAPDTHDYATSVKQLHEELILFNCTETVYKEIDYDDNDQFMQFLFNLNFDLNVMHFPRCRSNGRIYYEDLTFNQLNRVERCLVLACLSEGYVAQRNSYMVDIDMVQSLTSPKIITGCKDFKSASDRIDGNASSLLAKFKHRDFMFYNGVDIFQNSIKAAKCIAYSAVEKANDIQPRVELEQDFNNIESVPAGVTNKRILYGCGLNYNEESFNICGYRTTADLNMPEPGPVVRNFHLHEKLDVRMGWMEPRESDVTVHKAVGITSYNCKHNLAPIPDTNDSDNIKEGLIKRIGSAVPEPDKQTKVLLPLYVDEWISYYDLDGSIIDVLVEDVEKMLNWDEYVKTLRYSPNRLRQLLKIRKSVDEIGTFEFAATEEGKLMNFLWTKIEMHVKWESYHGEKKYVRGIFARMDEFKVFYGGFAKLTQKVMYKKLDSMVTQLPVRDLPVYFLSVFGFFDLIFGGDFSAMESHNYPWIMFNVSTKIIMRIFMYEADSELCRCFEVLTGINNIENKFQSASIHGKLMSGEVWTTIINSLTNQVLIMFVLESEGLIFGIGFYMTNKHRYRYGFRGLARPNTSCGFKIVVVGDDSLFGLSEISGVDYTKYTETDYLERYGMKFKLSMKPSIAGSGFLSKLYSENDLKTLCDPLKQLSKGILPMKYANSKPAVKKALARARAMSLLYEFEGCPIVCAYAQCILRCTKVVNIKRALVLMEIDDPYNHEKLAEAVAWYESLSDKTEIKSNKIGIESRIVIEDNFGISINTQLSIEEYFNEFETMNYPVEFDVPQMDLIAPVANYEFYWTHLSRRDENNDRLFKNKCDFSYFRERPVYSPVKTPSDWFDFVTRSTVIVP